MRKGFGNREESKSEFIKNFFKHSQAVLAFCESPEEAQELHSRKWYNDYRFSHREASREEILNPNPVELKIEGSSTFKDLGIESNTILGGWYGIWRILIHKRKRSKTLDFDIAVNTGGHYRFHPEVIRESICSTYGYDTYALWRKQVQRSIPDLEILVGEIRKELTVAAWSYTCCESAARLCRKVGLKQKHKTAFLFPSSYR